MRRPLAIQPGATRMQVLHLTSTLTANLSGAMKMLGILVLSCLTNVPQQTPGIIRYRISHWEPHSLARTRHVVASGCGISRCLSGKQDIPHNFTEKRLAMYNYIINDTSVSCVQVPDVLRAPRNPLHLFLRGWLSSGSPSSLSSIVWAERQWRLLQLRLP